MAHMRVLIAVVCLAVALGSSSDRYKLAWRDNFRSLDNWELDVMPGVDSGNDEWEYYTNSSDNVFLSIDRETGESMLVLQALAQKHEDYNFTSGKVHSKERLGPYGFYNVRAHVPHGLGLWPAIWMLPVGNSIYGGWAACGEIDFMETVCFDPNAYATLHFGGPWPNNTQTPLDGHNTFPLQIDWNQTHNWGFEWHPDYVQFWFDAGVVDGQIRGQNFFNITSDQWFSMTSEGVHYPSPAPFDVGFNMILNVAIGGWWPCSVAGCCDNVASQLPAQMHVYWVEVWETENATPRPINH